MMLRRVNAVHTILADLALILFITTASLSLPRRVHPPRAAVSAAATSPTPTPAPAVTLAVWQGAEADSPFAAWLGRQSSDPRAVLVLDLTYIRGSREAAWRMAQQLERTALASGRKVRVALREGAQDRARAMLSYEPSSPQE